MVAPVQGTPRLGRHFPVWVTFSISGKLGGTDGQCSRLLLLVHLLLCFAHLHKRLAKHVSRLQFREVLQARQLLNFVEPRASLPPAMPRLSRSMYYYPMKILIWLVLTLIHGARPGTLSQGFLSALGGMTRQGSWLSCLCLLPCSSYSGPGPLCWRVHINV